MNPFSEFRLSTRMMLRPVTAIMAGVAVVILALFAIGGGVVYLLHKSSIDKANNTPAKTVDLNVYVASFQEDFTCVKEGSKKCPEYTDAMNELQHITRNGMRYTIPDAKGVPQAPRTMTPGDAKGTATLVAIANVVGNDHVGLADPALVTVNGSNGSYITTRNGVRIPVVMNVNVEDTDVSLRSLTMGVSP